LATDPPPDLIAILPPIIAEKKTGVQVLKASCKEIAEYTENYVPESPAVITTFDPLLLPDEPPAIKILPASPFAL